MLKEFKKFLLRGNVVDLAVAVVVGAAFNAVVQSIVKDFITPLVTGFTGGSDHIAGTYTFRVLKHTVIFNWGDFLNTLISFIVIAAVVFFFVVQPINKLITYSKRHEPAPEPTDRPCPECLSAISKKAKRCKFCTAKVAPVKG